MIPKTTFHKPVNFPSSMLWSKQEGRKKSTWIKELGTEEIKEDDIREKSEKKKARQRIGDSHLVRVEGFCCLGED